MSLKDFLSNPISIIDSQFYKDSLNIIENQAGVGKTAFLIYLATEMIKNKKSFLFITNDEDKEHILHRILSNLTGIKLRDFKKNIDNEKIEELIVQFGNLIRIEGKSKDTIFEVRQYIRNFKKEGGEIVFIDSIRTIKGDPPFNKRISKAIFLLIKEACNLGITIISSASSEDSGITPSFLKNNKANLFKFWNVKETPDRVFLTNCLTNKSSVFVFNKEFISFNSEGEPTGSFVKPSDKLKLISMIDENKSSMEICLNLIKGLYPSGTIQTGSLTPQYRLKFFETKTGSQYYEHLASGKTDHAIFYSQLLNHAILYSLNFKPGTAEAFKNRFPKSKLSVFIPGDASKEAVTACKNLSIDLVSKDQFKDLASSL